MSAVPATMSAVPATMSAVRKRMVCAMLLLLLGAGAARLTSDLYRGGFSAAQEGRCPRGGAGLLGALLLASAASRTQQRRAARDTWAAPNALPPGLAVAFLVGTPAGATARRALQQENQQHRDVIIARVDDYGDTLKSLAALQWAHWYCAHAAAVLRARDDTFVNTEQLLAFINETRGQRAVWARVVEGSGAVEGGAWLAARGAVRRLLAAWLREPYSQREGRALAAAVARAGLAVRHAPEFCERGATCDVTRSVLVLATPRLDFYHVWSELQRPPPTPGSRLPTPGLRYLRLSSTERSARASYHRERALAPPLASFINSTELPGQGAPGQTYKVYNSNSWFGL